MKVEYYLRDAPVTICSKQIILINQKTISNTRCLLIDRDGTLVEHVPYLIDFEKVSFIPEVIEVLRQANRDFVPVYIVSNQAGVSHGYFTELDLVNLNLKILHALDQNYNVFVDGVLCCTSHPLPKVASNANTCSCRKPEPGLLLAAILEAGVVRLRTGILGDSDIDVSAGVNAGLGYTWKMSTTNRAQVRDSILSWMSGQADE
jgi:D-glycero-D-manno-heptose 1,7-bisphosphate phosphatase